MHVTKEELNVVSLSPNPHTQQTDLMEQGGDGRGRGGWRGPGRGGHSEGRGGRGHQRSFGQRGRGRGGFGGGHEATNGFANGLRPSSGGRGGRGHESDGGRRFDGPPRNDQSSNRGRGRGDADGRGKRSNGPPQTPLNLDEAFTMMVHTELQVLVEDGARFEMSFPKDLDNHQRRYIHSMAEKYGLFTKSSGKGENRFIHVAKVKKNANMEEVSLRLRPIKLNASTVSWFPPPVLEYLQQYPLTSEPHLDSWAGGELTPSWNSHHAGDQHRRASPPLFKPLKPSTSKANGSQQRSTRPQNGGTLPVHSYRPQILDLVERNQVVVISGDTGCGKSTQIPQFLLDDMIQRGEHGKTRIICSQPRRISAISLAERVAKERSSLGADPVEVGHAIRFDSSFDAVKSKLIFCTTGTLLKWLNSDPLALGFSHLILDEVHERDQFTDFLLILLKSNILHKRKDLKVILMSATIQVEKFAQYFQPEFEAPILEMVGGRCFPVTTLHLEDVLALIHHSNTTSLTPQRSQREEGDDEDQDDSDGDMPPADSGLICPMCQGGGFADEAAFGMHLATCFGQPTAPPPPPPKSDKPPKKKKLTGSKPRKAGVSMGEHLQQALGGVDASIKTLLLENYVRQEDALSRDQSVDYTLLLQLLYMIEQVFPRQRTEFEGAILVFLPGWEEISYMERELLRSQLTASTYEIAMLHSRLSAQEQRRAFLKPPRGKRKLILATNIAETSLTIEDVVFVIDCGKSKQAHALATTSSSSFVMGLQTTWVAKANCVQRMGRAGRVRPGVCFRLFSKTRYDTAMKEFMLPELLTTPLEELLLHIKLLQFEKKLHIRDAKEFLMRAMDSPSETSIDASLDRLEAMKALDKSKELTLVGWHLAHICDSGVSVHVGKLLLWSHVFGSFDAIVRTTCALSGYRDPFLNFLGMTNDELKQVEMAKQAFLQDAGTPLPVYSDHFVLLLAMEGFLQFHPRAYQEIDTFCRRNMLHRPTLEQVTSIYRQLERDMELLGMSSSSQLVAPAGSSTKAPQQSSSRRGAPTYAQWPRERLAPFFMALGGGMYPNVLYSKPTSSSRNWTSKEKVKVRLDSSSMLSKASFASRRNASGEDEDSGNVMEWIVYHEMMQSERTRVAKNASKLPSVLILLLLVGNNDQIKIEEHAPPTSDDDDVDAAGSAAKSWHLTLDEWIVFEFTTPEEVQAILSLRARLQAAFYRHLDRLHESHLHQQLLMQHQRGYGGRQTRGDPVSTTPRDPMLAVWKTHDEALANVLVSWVANDL